MTVYDRLQLDSVLPSGSKTLPAVVGVVCAMLRIALARSIGMSIDWANTSAGRPRLHRQLAGFRQAGDPPQRIGFG